MGINGLLFSFLGLWLLYRLLKRDFSPIVSVWVVLSVLFGTNLFHYTTKEMSIAHGYSFFLFVLLLYLLPNYLRHPGFRNSLILGAILGWIIVIRPTNAMVVLLLAGYDVYSWQDLKGRLIFFSQHICSLLWMSMAAIVICIPQLMYWHEMTGHWIYYSYNREGFWYWNKPKIAAVLFDVQNGLFLYSPLVLLMLIGVLYGIKLKKFHGPVLLLIFLIATYCFASWWTWWFGGAFGHRCYVEYYALLAIPLAGIYAKINSGRNRLLRYGFISLTILLMIYSVRLSYLNTTLPGPWDGKDWRWNWEKYTWIMSHFF